MPRITIIVDEPDQGISRTVQVADDEPANMLVMNLISELGLPELYGSMPISYGMEYPRIGRSLRDEETLRSVGVQPNDQLQLRGWVHGAAVSDLQVRRLRESFVTLRKPALQGDIRPVAAGSGYVSRLVIETTAASTGRTAPIPISSSSAGQSTAPQSTWQRTAPQPASPPQATRQPVVPQPPSPPQATGQHTAPQPYVPAPQPPPISPVPISRGKGIFKGTLITVGAVGVLLVVFLLGMLRGSNAGTGGTTVALSMPPVVASVVPGLDVDNEGQPEVQESDSNPTPEEPSSRPTLTPRPSTSIRSEPQQKRVVAPVIVSRDNWGGQPARGSNGVQTPQFIALSHDGQPIKSTTDAGTWLKSVQQNHFKRGWVDIAWHFAIDQHGTIYGAHDPRDRGDTNYHYDTDGIITVGVLGDYDSQTPSSDQVEAVVNLLAWLCQEYGISPDNIYPHSFFANRSPQTDPKITSPGRNFDMADIQARVRDVLERQ